MTNPANEDPRALGPRRPAPDNSTNHGARLCVSGSSVDQSRPQTLQRAWLEWRGVGISGSFTDSLAAPLWRRVLEGKGEAAQQHYSLIKQQTSQSAAFSDVVERILTKIICKEPWVQVPEGVGDRWSTAALAVVLTLVIRQHQSNPFLTVIPRASLAL